jgi:flagellar hook-associated protein FlgK
MAGLMDIGKSGLQSYREALSVTGQNIANINTDGYKRREASLAEVTGSSGGITSLSSQQGLGVRVEEIRRSFDEFLLNKARNARSNSASIENYLDSISQLEDILLPGDSNIGNAIGQFFETLQEVAANPSEIGPRMMVMHSADYLTSLFHQTAKLADEMQSGLLTQSEQAITEINYLTNNLANINRNIISSGKNAQNALLDNRDALIDKISEYVNVTIQLENSGAAVVTLGDTFSGPALVTANKSNNISVQQGNERLNFYVQKGATDVLTSQVTNGSLKGYSDAYIAISDTLQSLDYLAYKLIQDLNIIHKQGIDLESQPGGLFFHDINFNVIPSPSNMGSGGATIEIIDFSQVNSNEFIFSYDTDQNIWVARDKTNALIASGRESISLPGMKISFTGDPAPGDEISLHPMKGSAEAISLAISRPEDIAAALPFLISSKLTNAGNATLTATSVDTYETPTNLPNLQDVIANGHSATGSSQFMRDGAVALIPADVENIDLMSLIQQSSIHLGMPEPAISGVSTISLTIQQGNNTPKTYIFDLNAYASTINSASSDAGFSWTDAKQIARLMNVGALKATNGVDPGEFTLSEIGGHASGAGGNLNIALHTDTFTAGNALFSSYPTIAGVVSERIDKASDIQVFTREGRHIAGTSFTGIAGLVTAENGFYSSAEYRDDYLNRTDDAGYMGMTVKTSADFADELINVSDTDTGHRISFDRINEIDGADGTFDGSRASASIFDYTVSVGGFSAQLDEGNVDGHSAEAIAKAAIEVFRSNAPIPSLAGLSSLISTASFTITADQKTTLDTDGELKVTYSGIDYYLGKDGSSYSITGGRADKLSLSFDPATRTVTTTYPELPEDGAAVALAFEGQTYMLSMKDGEVAVTGGEPGRLIARYDNNFRLQISASNGSISRSDITIVDDATLSNNLGMAKVFGLITDTSTPVTSFANDTGYTIPDFDISIDGASLVVTKDANHLDDVIAISTNVGTKIGERITLKGLPREELLVFITGSDDGNGVRARSISAVYDMAPDTGPALPRDLTVSVLDAQMGIFEVIDTATNSSLATRQLDVEGVASCLGYRFTFDGTILKDDAYFISNNEGGVFDNRNIQRIIDLKVRGKDQQGGFQEIFANLVLGIGADIQSNKLNADAALALKDASIEAEAMYTGVNLDTEASRLIEYQQAYQASARILQTAREIFRDLLEMI